MARILLVDDEPEIRVLTRIMLEKASRENYYGQPSQVAF
jgi:CheY-like chemotaxis protein